MFDMRSRTDSGSRRTWWCANIEERSSASLKTTSSSLSVMSGSFVTIARSDDVRARLKHVALHALERVDVVRGLLEPLVLLKTAHELGARILFVLVAVGRSAAAASAI